MRIVIEIPDDHVPMVRQQARVHGTRVRLDFPAFPFLIPGNVLGFIKVYGGIQADEDVFEPLEAP